MERWMITAKSADFNRIGEEFRIDPVIARLIRNRDIVGDDAIREYLYGTLGDLPSWTRMKGLREAVSLIYMKIEERKNIRIIGDYDIDGVCSTYILLQGLRQAGASVDIDIPDRIKDGYGLNEELIARAYEQGIDTIITCDNGISASEQIAYGKELGMTMVVTDHHEVPFQETEGGEIKEILPPADVVVNPKQKECGYPFKGLCGAGVAYKLVCGLFEHLGVSKDALEELLEFVAIATVGDVMDLQGENRILVKEGLKRIQNTRNTGLRELIRANQLEDRKITSYHIGFILGPCMNASGRLSTAKRALSLLECRDPSEAAVLAQDLKSLNDSRKDMTAKATEEAVQMVENTSLGRDKVLVIYLPECHESLAGIVAGRIRERYGKPAFVLTRAEEGVKGSGRSIEAFHMFHELVKCREYLTKFGGHPMAAGLSLEEKNIEPFREKINSGCSLTEEDFVTKVLIDVPMPLNYINKNLISQLSLLEPFGKGNQKPLFAQKKLRLMGARVFGKNKNVVKMKAVDETGYPMEAVYFGDGEAFVQEIRQKEEWSVAYYPELNSYMGRETLQIVVQNLQ